MRRTPGVLVGLSLLALACGKDAEPGAAPSASATSAAVSETPTPSPTPTGPRAVTAGDVFYSDTFKDTSKGWTQKSDANATYKVHTDYASPVYTVTANKGGVHLFPHPEFRGIGKEQLRDYEITATIQSTLSVGRRDWFGVTCRDLTGSRYVFRMGLGMDKDERAWQIAELAGGKTEVLAEGTHTVGGSAWEVSGACAGGTDGGPATLVMKINGEVAGQAEDPTPLLEGYGGVYLLSNEGRSTVNVLTFAARAVTVA